MTLVDSTVTGELAIPDAVQAGSLASDEVTENREGWKAIVDLLLAWLSAPPTPDFEEVLAIDRHKLQSALDFADDMRRAITPLPLPSNVAPTPDGGIEFEWKRGHDVQLCEVVGVGRCEVSGWKGRELVFSFEMQREPHHRGWHRD